MFHLAGHTVIAWPKSDDVPEVFLGVHTSQADESLFLKDKNKVKKFLKFFSKYIMSMQGV